MNLEVRFVPLESRLQELQFEHNFDLIRTSDEEYTDPIRFECKLSEKIVGESARALFAQSRSCDLGLKHLGGTHGPLERFLTGYFAYFGPLDEFS